MDNEKNNEIQTNIQRTDIILENLHIDKRHPKAVEINLKIKENDNVQTVAIIGGLFGFIVGFILFISFGTFTGVGTISTVIAIIISISSDSSKLVEMRNQYWIETNKEYLLGFENFYNQVISNYSIRPKTQAQLFIARNEDEIIFVPEISSYIELINSGSSEELINSIDNNEPFDNILKSIKIKLKDIRYFGIKGEIENVVNVSGGGTSYGKAIIGAALFGPVGAIVGSRNKIQTNHEKIDSREVEFKYQNGNILETIVFPIELYTGLEQIIPELEENNIKINSAKNNLDKITSNKQDKNTKNDILNELIKLKQLLDSGAINEEEFNKLKSEILN